MSTAKEEGVGVPQAADCGPLTVRPTFDPTKVTLANCTVTPQDVVANEDVTYNVDVFNGNDVDAVVDIEWRDKSTGQVFAQVLGVTIQPTDIGETVSETVTPSDSRVGDHDLEVAFTRKERATATASLASGLQGETAGVDRGTLAAAGLGVGSGVAMGLLR